MCLIKTKIWYKNVKKNLHGIQYKNCICLRNKKPAITTKIHSSQEITSREKVSHITQHFLVFI